MAPKSKVHSRKSSENPRERSPMLKRKRDTSKASSSVPDLPSTTSCASKSVTTGRCIYFHFLEREGFEIGENLISLGFQRLCSLEIPTYPNLVREFYGMTARTPERIVGTVRGVSILVSKELLGFLLEIPITGQEPYYIEKRELALNTVLDREDCNPYMVISANDLEAESRLLLSIIGRILFPKTGRFEFISERDLAIMYHILNTISFDMGSMMISHISASTGKNRFSLPYGMVFTLIFRHYNIPISEKESTIKLCHTDYYSDSTLRRMGFSKKNGSWVKVDKSPKQPHAPTTDIPETSNPMPEHQSPASPIPATNFDAAPPELHSSPAPPHSQPSISSEHMAILSTTILNAITPKLDELQKQNNELQTQILELKTAHFSQLEELKTQNLQLQAQLATQQVIPSSSSTSTPIDNDTIQALAKAILTDFREKFDELKSHIMKVTEDMEDLEATMSQFQKKINKASETLLKHVWDISLQVQDEHKDYGIEGISKELGMLKEKIDDAVQAIALLMHDLKTNSSHDIVKLSAQLGLLTKEISKRFMLRL